jgi:putative membrane-bound dehydrogenase-like protein
MNTHRFNGSTVQRFNGSILLSVLALAINVPTSAAEFTLGNHTFTVPDGFVIELVAAPELAPRPVSASFDEQGRLYVTDSSGSNEKPDQQVKNPTHRVLRLEDTDGDGRFDKSVAFADKVMFPEGCLWHEGSVYVAGPPSIWKFTDTDGDGVADKREEWYKGGVLTGCANDVHGPYLGPEGRIYWTKGAFARLDLKDARGRPINDRCAHIFRARPDGSELEVVMSGGMDNPVEVAFTPLGEPIFTSTFMDLEHPGTRDGLGHAVYGGVFGKRQDALDEPMVKRTGDILPVMTHFGPGVPSGLCRYESEAFGAEYRDSFFVTLFNLHKITRHVLREKGATFVTEDSDFVVSNNMDFHPTDVLEDADGSLLIVDTGGWYKLCCPSSQLAKPDVLGGIYRVRRKDAPLVADARGLRLRWTDATAAELVKRLDDKRPAVRERAMAQLARGDQETIRLLGGIVRAGASATGKRNALWTLARMDHPSARQPLLDALESSDASVAQVAAKVSALWRDPTGAARLFSHALLTGEPGRVHLKRAAIEALGRCGSALDLNALFSATKVGPGLAEDRFLEHSLIYALIEIGDAPAVRRTMTSGARGATLRMCLIALDQMDGQHLRPAEVQPHLNSPDATLRDTARWIVRRHPDWGTELAGWFRERLAGVREAEREDLTSLLAQVARSEAIQRLLVQTATDSGTAELSRQVALHAMARAGLREPPSAWRDTLIGILGRGTPASPAASRPTPPVLTAAVATARALPAPKEGDPALAGALADLARDTTLPDELRLDALAALPGGAGELDAAVFDFLRKSLEPERPVGLRGSAAGVLAKAKLTPTQLSALTDILKTIGPIELPKLLPAFDVGGDQALGLKLIDALKASPAVSTLRADLLKPRLAKFPPSVQHAGDALLLSVHKDAAEQNARLDSLLEQLKDGDIRRGQAIFNSQKTACAACHRLGYLGGNIGPDLTSIGQVRSERDLLEAIVYPSASFVRSYEPVLIITKSGEDYSGALRKDTTEEIVLATGPDTEVRIARADIKETRPGTVSVMPAGLDEQLTRQEMADLLAFLKNTRWGPQ